MWLSSIVYDIDSSSGSDVGEGERGIRSYIGIIDAWHYGKWRLSTLSCLLFASFALYDDDV
jgi:hypothetical protein